MALTPVTDNTEPAPIPPEAGAQPARGADDTADGKIGAMIAGMAKDAQDYNTEVIQPAREEGTKLYYAEKFGNEEEGRSQVVTTDVRDAFRNVMPSLLRIFTGPENYVEYAPRFGKDEEQAKQKTDYVNYCLGEDPNSIFLLYYAWFKDTLIRRIGFVKWYWDESVIDEETEYSGLSLQQFDSLVADPDVTIDQDSVQKTAPDAALQIPETYTCNVRRILKYGQLRVLPLAGEEVFWDRNARDFITQFRCVVHSREARLDEIVALGYEEEEITPYVGPSAHHTESVDMKARREQEGLGNASSPVLPETPQPQETRPIRFCEMYVRMPDPDAPDPAAAKVHLYRVHTVGDHFHVLDYERCSHVQIAYLIADPEPHTINGLGYADDGADLQRIHTAVTRGLLDSLALALTPRVEVVEKNVNLADLMNTEVGGAIRVVGATGQVKEFSHHFVGADIQPAFDRLDAMKEGRFGQTRANLGLDAKALQSTGQAAIDNTISKYQERTEMLARIFSETGVRAMYQGILRTIMEHQDRKRTVRLRGRWVEVDPRAWNTGMDVIVNVALGYGLADTKLKVLSGIIDKMESILQNFGPMNPLVDMTRYRNALARAIELMGYPNPDEFWKPFDAQAEQQWMQQMQGQGQQQQPPPDPAAMAAAQAEIQKVQLAAQKQQADIAARQQELALRQHVSLLEDQRLRERDAADRVLQIHELALKYKTQVDRHTIDAEIEREHLRIEADTKARVAQINANAGGGET